MHIQLATWADFGYRQVGPLPASGNGRSAEWLAQMLAQQGGYQIADGLWVRRPARRRGAPPPECMSIAAVLDVGTPLDDAGLAFLDGFETSEWVRMADQIGRPRTEPELPAEVVQAAASEDVWRAMYRLHQALAWAHPRSVRSVLRRHVAPFFFSRHPRGKIVALRYGTEIDTAAAMLRVLYAQAQAPYTDYLAGAGGFTGIRTLQHWHHGSLMSVLPPLVDLFNYLFYPFVGGFCATPHGLDLVFMFEPAEHYKPATFPRNWLGLPSRNAVFGGELVGPLEVLADMDGPAAWRAAHQRFQHDSAFGVDERLTLFRWYVERLNRFLFELTDAANFTDRNDPAATLDPVFGYEHELTVDRLMRRTLLAMSLDEAPAGNLTAFEVADLYDTLGQRFGNRRADGRRYGAVEFFKALFHPQEGPALLAPRMATLPPPFGDYFTRLASQAYHKIEETVLESVWVPGKVTTTGVLVRGEDLGPEAPMPVSDFVAEVMRAYRNAHHGYFSADPTSRNRPSRFLYLVDGNLPVEMSLLPPLWWLAYLADPGLVGWKHLGVGAYD